MPHTQPSLGGRLPPLSVRISDACRMTGIGRSKLYELIKDGAVEVIKVGAITLIPMSSLQALLDRGHREPASPRCCLADTMPPFLVSAILAASLAGTTEAVRRDLASCDDRVRASAEDSVAERMVAALYEPYSEKVGALSALRSVVQR